MFFMEFLLQQEKDQKADRLFQIFEKFLPGAVAVLSPVEDSEWNIEFFNDDCQKKFTSTFQDRQSTKDFRFNKKNQSEIVIEDLRENNQVNIYEQLMQVVVNQGDKLKKSLLSQQNYDATNTLKNILNNQQQNQYRQHYSSCKRYQYINGKLNEVPCEVTITQIEYNDQPCQSILLIIQDVISKKCAEDCQYSNNYKDFILDSITHDLKTPLNSIICQTKHALVLTDIQQIKNNISIIDKNSKLLLYQVYSILDSVNYLNNGNLDLRKQYFRLNELVDEIQELFSLQASIKKLKFVHEFKGDFSEQYLCSDRRRLMQVLINLMQNALKYTFTGHIIVNIEEVDLECLRFSVSDTGIGLSEEQLRNLFKPKQSGKDYGLGLQFSQFVVGCVGPQQKIEVKSVQNKGSTFSFTIFKCLTLTRRRLANACGDTQNLQLKQYQNRRFQGEDQEISEESDLEIQNVIQVNEGHYKSLGEIIKNSEINMPVQHNNYSARKRVLLVDDEAFNHVAFAGTLTRCEALQEENLQIEGAFNGQQALETIMRNNLESKEDESSKYLCVVMDHQMPVMNGTEACKIIKQKIHSGEFYDLPIIMCSANDSLQDKKSYRDAGAIYFLQKPLSRIKLSEIIDSLRKGFRKNIN